MHHLSKTLLGIVVASLFLFGFAMTSWAGWLVYHKPAYQGRVLDAETNEPIEGAVVVAIYEKRMMRIPHGGPIGIYVAESLTDKEGRFRIPSYTTMIDPLSWAGEVPFIVFKPGYAVANGGDMDLFFGGDQPPYTEIPWNFRKDVTIKFGPSWVGIQKLKTRSDRIHNLGEVFNPDFKDKTPLLNSIVQEERGIIKY